MKNLAESGAKLDVRVEKPKITRKGGVQIHWPRVLQALNGGKDYRHPNDGSLRKMQRTLDGITPKHKLILEGVELYYVPTKIKRGVVKRFTKMDGFWRSFYTRRDRAFTNAASRLSAIRTVAAKLRNIEGAK